MEGEIAGQENPIRSTSENGLNSIPSAIVTNSISIELSGAIRYNARGMEHHDHFSLREFVAGVRERDWLKCYPFPLGVNDDKTDNGQRQLLPPLDAPKHKWWRCKCCVDELCAEKGQQASNCGTGAECSSQVPRICNYQDMETDLLETRTINANHCNVGFTNHYTCLLDERAKAEVAKSTMIGNQMRLGDNASGLVPVLKSPSPEDVNPMVMPERHKNDACSEIDGLSDNEPTIRNLKWMVKCASESCKSGELTVTANHRHTESTEACTKVAEGTVVKVADNGLPGQATGFSCPDSENCNSLSHKHQNSSEKDSQDRHLDKLSSSYRRKARKFRQVADLLGEKGDTKNKHVRIQEMQENITYNPPAVLSALGGPQDKLDGQINLKSLSQNRKRKIPPEEVDIFAKKVVDKAIPNTEEEADKDYVIQSSRSEDPWTDRVLQNGLSRQWNNAERDRRLLMVKNNNEKIREADAYSHLELSRDEERENMGYDDNGATQVGQSDNLDLKLAPATFTGHEMPLFPLHGNSENAFTLSNRKDKMPQLGENLASLSCKNGKVSDIPMHQRNEDISQMGQIAVCKEKGIGKGLQLSLNSCCAAKGYDRELVAPCNDTQSVPHFKNRLPISFPSQFGTSKVDQVVRKEMRSSVSGESSICLPYGAAHINGKGIVGEPSSQTATLGMPVMNENIYREVTGSNKIKRTVETQNSSVVVKKQFNQTSDKVAEQGDIDDIPMEIVELMAKNQYERGLPDAGKTNFLLQTNNLRRNQQMVNWVTKPSSVDLILLGKKTSQKRKSKERDGRNGFIVTGENDGVQKGKSVDYFSPFDANYHNIYSRGQSHYPFAIGEVCRSKTKPPSDFPIFPGNSNGLSGALSYKWNDGTLGYNFPQNSGQDSGGCDRHKTILHPDGEAFRIWTATSSKHIPKGYDVPTKTNSQSINMDMFSHGSTLLHDHNIQRHDNVQLFNLNTMNAGKPNIDYVTESSIRSSAGFPFSSKPSGIEIQKSSSGSGDFYSNDTIPAMHLLSLMQSGTSFDVNACAVAQNGASYPHDYNAKLDIGTSRDKNYAKHLSSNYFGNNYMTQKSNCSFRGSPPFGASTSLGPHDGSLLRDSNVTDQILPNSGKKMKSSKSNMQIRTCNSQKSTSTDGESHKEYGIIPVQRSRKLPAVHDHVSIGCPHTGNENYANLNLQSRDACGASRPLRKSLEPKICSTNRNPADFSAPDEGSDYMIKGEDLRFEKAAHYRNVGLTDQRGFKHHRNLKLTSQKERTKH